MSENAQKPTTENTLKEDKPPTPVETQSQENSVEQNEEDASTELQEKNNETKNDGEIIYGITSDKQRFIVPRTYDVIESVITPKKWKEFPIAFEILASMTYIFLYFWGASKWFFLVSFIFWRLMYNCGIGFLLYQQSKYNRFTNWYIKYIKNNPKMRSFYLKCFSTKEHNELGKEYKIEDYPDQFNAWMGFRAIVDIILGLDFVVYLLFAASFIETPEKIGLLDILFYIVGAILCLFNFWAKSDAHRVIGDFAWYWGDFFFLIDKSLVFDGIFQMFPHPMYTVGYSFYYGLSLITRSYVVLYVSLFAHVSQLIFLSFVEEPHIEKTYGVMTESDPVRDQILYDSNNGYIKKNREHKYFINFEWFRASDFFFLIIVIYCIILSFIPGIPKWFCIAHVVAWRLLHSVGLGIILYYQSKTQYWTKRFISKGGTKQEAFESWKRLYNMSATMNHLVFLIFAIKMYSLPSEFGVYNYAKFCLFQTIGLGMVLLNVWANYSAYQVLGDFGWFYGDFFVDNIPKKLYYTGIYRYLNNPDLVLGFLGYYGLAIMAKSYEVAALAVFSHFCMYYFNKIVEKPHMERLYGKDRIREHSGIEIEVRENLKKVKPKLEKLKDELSQKVDELKNELEKIQLKVGTQEGRTELAKELKEMGNKMMGKLKEKIKLHNEKEKIH